MKISISVKAQYKDTECFVDCEGCTDELEIRELCYEALKEENEELENDEDFTEDSLSFEVDDWGELSEYDNLCDINLYYELNDTEISYDLDVVSAAVSCDIRLSDIDEAYAGSFGDDAEFAQNLCEDCGDVPSNLPSYIYIDWERTARDIMYDYTECDGHYFRML